jgi:hypothetical protein
VRDGNRYPWEDRFMVQANDYLLSLGMRNDPYDVPEIKKRLSQKPQYPTATYSRGPATKMEDCFSRLPVEVSTMIALELPTEDALNICRASRAFLPILQSQCFWASRFKTNAERSWLFESQGRGKYLDWSWLYRQTNKAYRSAGMQNRIRVWKLAHRIRETLAFEWIDLPKRWLSDINPTDPRWVRAAGDLRVLRSTGLYDRFDEGCRLSRKQQVLFLIFSLGLASHSFSLELLTISPE